MPELESFMRDFITLLTDIQSPLDAVLTSSILLCVGVSVVLYLEKIIKRFLKI